MRKRKERDEEVEGKMEGWIRMARFLLVLLFNLPPYSTVRAEACRRRLPSLSSYRQASAKLQEVRLFPRHSSITSRKMHRKVSQPSWANIPSQKGQLLSFHLIPLNPPFSISLPSCSPRLLVLSSLVTDISVLSRRPFQIHRFRPDHEEQRLQSHRRQPIPSGHRLPPHSARPQPRGSTRTSLQA